MPGAATAAREQQSLVPMEEGVGAVRPTTGRTSPPCSRLRSILESEVRISVAALLAILAACGLAVLLGRPVHQPTIDPWYAIEHRGGAPGTARGKGAASLSSISSELSTVVSLLTTRRRDREGHGEPSDETTGTGDVPAVGMEPFSLGSISSVLESVIAELQRAPSPGPTGCPTASPAPASAEPPPPCPACSRAPRRCPTASPAPELVVCPSLPPTCPVCSAVPTPVVCPSAAAVTVAASPCPSLPPSAPTEGGAGAAHFSSVCSAPACTALRDDEWAAERPAVLPRRYRAEIGPRARPVLRGAYTVMLALFKRPNLARQLAALDAQTLRPHHIHVFQTDHHIPDAEDTVAALNRSDVSVVHVSGYDFKYHGRFLPLLMVQTEYVAVLDDDVFPQPGWFRHAMAFVEARGRTTTIAGSTGRIASFATPPSDTPADPTRVFQSFASAGVGSDHGDQPHPVEVDFVIHSYFAHQNLMRFFFALPHYTWDNGEDISLCAALQIAVGARCWVPSQLDADGTRGDAGNEGGDAHASFRRPGHAKVRAELVHYWVDLGWRPLRLDSSARLDSSGLNMTRRL